MTTNAHPTSERDARRYLDLAARAALRAAGDAEPNPLVGCVLVRDGVVLGTGHHRRFGELHAERDALAACARNGHSPRGAIAYVTLEPCRHTGKQPPCTEALIEAGVARVVCARPDPGEVSGGGAEVLRKAGIAFEYTDASRSAFELSTPFVHRLTTGRPWVIAKWAQTLDGKIATATGESQWISNERSRARVHRLRARVDAILTGRGTVERDDPLLTARGVRRVRRIARRVVIDSGATMEATTALVRTARDVPVSLYATKNADADRVDALRGAGVEVNVDAVREGRVDLAGVLRHLYDQHSVATVLVEAGPGLLGALHNAELIDEMVVYVAPTVFGDPAAPSAIDSGTLGSLADGRGFRLVRTKRVGDDMELVYRRLS